ATSREFNNRWCRSARPPASRQLRLQRRHLRRPAPRLLLLPLRRRTTMMSLNGSQAESLTSPLESIEGTTDVWRHVLAEVLAEERRNWTRERELIEAQAKLTVAELRAYIVEMREAFTAQRKTDIAQIKADVASLVLERLAELKNGDIGPQGERGEKGERGE